MAKPQDDDSPAVTPLALRPHAAAKALSISERTLWSLTTPRGPIPCVRVGAGERQTVLYPVETLRAWLTQQLNSPVVAAVEE